MKLSFFYILLLFLLAWFHPSHAQDPHFSQFYAAPLNLNPALTGGTDRSRFGMNYRNQWPSLSHSFQTISAYIDYYAKGYNSGIGLIVKRHRESFLKYTAMEVGASYAYKLRVSDDLALRSGVQISYFNKNIAFEELVFGNQIDIQNGIVIGPSGESFDTGLKVNFMSVSAGGILYTNKFWIGAAVHHINEPNQSLMEDESPLPRKYSFHIGYKYAFSNGQRLRTVSYQFQKRSVSFSANYKTQGGFNQMDVGMQLFFQPLVLGLMYRGTPFQKLNELAKNESVIVLLGLELSKDFGFAYSYDFTVSKLAGSTGGAHEFSFAYAFGRVNKRTRRDMIMPCFKY